MYYRLYVPDKCQNHLLMSEEAGKMNGGLSIVILGLEISTAAF